MSVASSVASALEGRWRLLVFDNCEHVLDAAADMIEAILAHSATVRIPATSREGLRVADEQLWPVPSLDVLSGVDSAAATLFMQRAAAVAPGISLAGAEAGAGVGICGRLDGMPLAIELAASRMQSMTVTDLRDRLDDRFRPLVGLRRGWNATTHCVTRWRGPMTCSMTPKRRCWQGVRCSPEGSTSPLSAQSVAAATTWPHWMCSMRPCASPFWSPPDHRGGPGFRCWRASAGSPKNNLWASGSADEAWAAARWLIFPTLPWLCGRQRRTPPWWDIRGRSCIPRRVRAWLPNPDGRGDG